MKKEERREITVKYKEKMKKLFLAALIGLLGYGAMAQLPVNLGIHGGISSNRIKVKDIPSTLGTRAHTGYMLGAFARINLGKLYIEPSLNFSHKESVWEKEESVSPNTPATTEVDYHLKVNSFDIPLLVGYEVLDLSILKLRAFFGPVISFPKLKDIQQIGHTDKTNWHGKIGVGVDVWKLTFDIDYEKAFKSLGHDLKAPRSFNFTLGLKII